MTPSLKLLVPVTLYVLYRTWRRNAKRKSLPLPPGPKGMPLIGNLLDMPKSLEWVTYHEWAKEFNTDILYLNVSGRVLIILDTASAAEELLEKRSSRYSGRSFKFSDYQVDGADMGLKTAIANDKGGDGMGLEFYHHGIRRLHRRLMHHSFSANAVRQFLPHVTKASIRFLNLMLDRPKNLGDNLRSMAGQTILAIAYGIEVEGENDPYLEIVHRAVDPVNDASVPGTFLVDVFPFLKYVPSWMPGASFKRKAKLWRSYGQEMLQLPFEATKRMMESAACPPSFSSVTLELKDTSSFTFSEETVKTTAGTMYSAGADTTVAVLSCCVLGLLDRPDVLRRAQDDLDRVIKRGHLPTFDDEPSVPFTTAIIKEAMRWRVITPIALPHSSSSEAEDEYNGHRIPAGSIVLANAWAMLHNDEVYPEPHAFRPERFMKDGKLDTSILDPDFAVWGFGRRICPGRHFAFRTVWITLASLIYTFNIEKEVDLRGNSIEPNPEFILGAVQLPKPFPCRVSPRSTELERLVRNYDADII